MYKRQVGIDPTIENIIFTEAGEEEPEGFIVDIVRGFAAELGVEVKWEILEWSAMLTAVNTGKVDFIAANMNMRLDREAEIDFSDPWLVDSAMACVAKDSAYQSFEDLKVPGTKSVSYTHLDVYKRQGSFCEKAPRCRRSHMERDRGGVSKRQRTAGSHYGDQWKDNDYGFGG